jgi:hypothetical protein
MVASSRSGLAKNWRGHVWSLFQQLGAGASEYYGFLFGAKPDRELSPKSQQPKRPLRI